MRIMLESSELMTPAVGVQTTGRGFSRYTRVVFFADPGMQGVRDAPPAA